MWTTEQIISLLSVWASIATMVYSICAESLIWGMVAIFMMITAMGMVSLVYYQEILKRVSDGDKNES